MSEFEEKLNAILSNPDALAQVASLAQSLNLGGGQGESGGEETERSGGESAPSGGGPGGLDGLAGLGDLLGKLDPKLLERLLPMAGELLGGDSGGDERLQLLYALRPYLRPERQEKVERAIQLARLFHLGKKFLAGWGGLKDV